LTAAAPQTRSRTHRHAGGNFFTRRTGVRLAFILIVVFQIAQVAWWLIFQREYVMAATTTVTASWEREARLANLALDAAPAGEHAAIRQEIAADYPHLDATGSEVVVSKATLEAFRERQMHYLTMFAFEGPFFLFVILAGLYVIGVSFRSDQELKRRQRNFLMAASHEFRTPLSTLRLLVQTIEHRDLPREKERSYIAKIGKELTRLEDVSARVLATARLEHAPAATLEVADLRSLVRAHVAEARHGLEARGAAIRVEEGMESVPVAVDDGALSLALSNLLDNAVKYSPGTVKPVVVRVGRRDGRGVIQVDDEGIGVPEAEVENIFEQFYRVGNEATRESAGLGLGLHLVRSVSELMGGRATCERLEKGTRFTLSFPLAGGAA
jgi:signal transduction histidine kinase